MAQALLDAVDRAVAQVIAEQNGNLTALIVAALDRHLTAMVTAEIGARADAGFTAHAVDVSAAVTAHAVRDDTKTCRLCGLEKPATAFETGRHQCRTCRAAAAKQRQKEPSHEATRSHEDRTSEPPQPSGPPRGFVRDGAP